MYQYICDGVRFAMKTKGMGCIIVEKVCLLVLKLDNVNQNRIKPTAEVLLFIQQGECQICWKCQPPSDRLVKCVGNANPLLIG